MKIQWYEQIVDRIKQNNIGSQNIRSLEWLMHHWTFSITDNRASEKKILHPRDMSAWSELIWMWTLWTRYMKLSTNDFEKILIHLVIHIRLSKNNVFSYISIFEYLQIQIFKYIYTYVHSNLYIYIYIHLYNG